MAGVARVRPRLRPFARFRAGGLGYSGFIMFDVLVYLYENYWRPDACPDHQQLSRKLSAVGFESDEIQEALRWLDGLANSAEARVAAQQSGSLRVYSDAERDLLGEDSIDGPIELEDLKVIVLMVFWSLGEEPDALILDELFVDPEDRLIH
jgi:Smg protein